VAGFAEYEAYDALGLAELVRSGQVTPDELLDAAIERVDARNGAVNAVIGRNEDRARQAIKSGLPTGPFTRRPLPAQRPRRLARRGPRHPGLALLQRYPTRRAK